MDILMSPDAAQKHLAHAAQADKAAAHMIELNPYGCNRKCCQEHENSAFRQWAQRARSKQATTDELLLLALKMIAPNNNDKTLTRKLGTSYRMCARFLRAAATRMQAVHTSEKYVQYAAWSLLNIDPYLVAALRLECLVLPCQPEYSWMRFARDHAGRAASILKSSFSLLRSEDAESTAHDGLLRALETADVEVLRRLLIPPRGYRAIALRPHKNSLTFAVNLIVRVAASGFSLYSDGRDTFARSRWALSLQCAELLLSCGADLRAVESTSCQTALHTAAATLQSDLVELFACTPSLVSSRDKAGRCPLHLVAATLFKRASIVRRASKRRSDAETMFARASSEACMIARTLLRIGGSEHVIWQDKFGQTALGISCSSGETSALAKILLEATFAISGVRQHTESLMIQKPQDDVIASGPHQYPERMCVAVRDAMLVAARARAHRSLALLLEHAGDLMADWLRMKLLEIAVQRRSLGTLASLFKICAKGQYKSGIEESWSAFHLAASCGDESMCRFLIEHGAFPVSQVAADIGEVASMRLTAASGHATVVERAEKLFAAVKLKSNQHARTPFERTPKREGPKILWDPAAIAAFYGNFKIVALCVSESRSQRCALGGISTICVLTAAILGGTSISELLEALEAVPHLTRKEIKRAMNSADRQFYTTKPLLLAASLGCLDAVADLLRFGADPNVHRRVKHVSLIHIETEIEKLQSELACAQTELQNLEMTAQMSNESGENFAMRVCKARESIEAVDEMWQRVETELRHHEGATKIAAMFLVHQPKIGAYGGIIESAAHALLLILGEISPAEPVESAFVWWNLMHRVCRRLRLIDDLMALRSIPENSPLRRNCTVRVVALAAAACDQAAKSESNAPVLILGLLGSWFHAVIAAVDVAQGDQFLTSVVNAQRRYDSLKRRLELKRAQKFDVANSQAARLCGYIGVASLSLGSPGAPRGDSRGPVRSVREVQERHKCVVFALRAGADVERCDHLGQTILGLACTRGYWQLALHLIETYCSHPDGGISPVEAASSDLTYHPMVNAATAASVSTPGAIEVLSALLRQGGASTWSRAASAALDAALKTNGDFALSLLLISCGACPLRGDTQGAQGGHIDRRSIAVGCRLNDLSCSSRPGPNGCYHPLFAVTSSRDTLTSSRETRDSACDLTPILKPEVDLSLRLRKMLQAFFSLSLISSRKRSTVVDYATRARTHAKNANLRELLIGDSAITTYYVSHDNRLQAVDERHKYFGVALQKMSLSEPHTTYVVELEDGSTVPVSQLIMDVRLYYKLRVTARPPIHTILHVAAKMGDVTDCALLLEACIASRCGLTRGSSSYSTPSAAIMAAKHLLSAPDATGCTPLGLAIKCGKKSVVLFMLERLRSCRHISSTQLIEPDFDSLFAWPAKQSLDLLKREISILEENQSAELEGACFSGLTHNLSTHLVDLCTLQPTRNDVASLWISSDSVPPLQCAERARCAMQHLSMAPSNFEDPSSSKIKKQTASMRTKMQGIADFESISLDKLLARVPAQAVTMLKNVLAPDVKSHAYSNLERTLLLFHQAATAADEIEQSTRISSSRLIDGVVPDDVLNEVRTYWANTERHVNGGRTPLSATQQLSSFLKIWREEPSEVLRVLSAARRSLCWLRRLVAARVLAIAARCVHGGCEDGQTTSESTHAFEVASTIFSKKRRIANLTSKIAAAEKEANRVAAFGQRIARATEFNEANQTARPTFRCSELIQRSDWIQVMCCPEDKCGASFAAYRRNLVDAIAALLHIQEAEAPLKFGGSDVACAVEGVRQGFRNLHGSQEGMESQTQAAVQLLSLMRHYDLHKARTAVRQRKADVAAAKGLATILDAATIAEPEVNATINKAMKEVCECTIFWMRAVLYALEGEKPHVQLSAEENVLLDAIRAFGDDEDVLPKLVDHLGARECARLALRRDTTGECALRLATSRWTPCVLTALLRAGANPLAAPAPSLSSCTKSLLRCALEAAPRLVDACGRPIAGRDAAKGEAVALTALVTLLEAAPAVVAESTIPSSWASLVELASLKGYARLVDKLLAAGAVLEPSGGAEAISSSRTALHSAAAIGEKDLAVRLLSSILRNGSIAAARAMLCSPQLITIEERRTFESRRAAAKVSSSAETASFVLARLRTSAQPKSTVVMGSGTNREIVARYAHYPIHIAIRHGFVALVSFLLEALKDPEAACGERAASSSFQKNEDCVWLRRFYRDTIYGKILLHEAAYARQPAVLAALLKNGGFDVSTTLIFPPLSPKVAVSPLDVATRRNCVEAVCLLLRAGARPVLAQAQQSALRGYDAVSTTLLNSLLTHSDHVDDARDTSNTILLVDVDASLSGTAGETMLHVATRNGCHDLAHVLLAAGSSLWRRDAGGACPIHNAVAAGHGNITQLLASFCHEYDMRASVIAHAYRRYRLHLGTKLQQRNPVQ